MTRDTKGIFISYRRAKNAAHAGWLGETLSEHFGSHKVFRDIDSIEPGLDFVEAIERALGSSGVLIAIIGESWLTMKDATGRPQLQNPDDYVRLEIATALKHNVRIIPVLVQEATMPRADELPEDLAALSYRNALELRDTRWRDDVQSLIATLEKVVKSEKEDTRRSVALERGIMIELITSLNRHRVITTSEIDHAGNFYGTPDRMIDAVTKIRDDIIGGSERELRKLDEKHRDISLLKAMVAACNEFLPELDSSAIVFPSGGDAFEEKIRDAHFKFQDSVRQKIDDLAKRHSIDPWTGY